MIEDAVSYGRQTLILDPVKAKKLTVHVLGCGTVGSNAAVELSRMGVGKIHIYDMDTVEAHNIPSQRFGTSDMGEEKTLATKKAVEEVSSHVSCIAHGEIHGGEMYQGIVVLAVDSLDLRKKIWETSLKYSSLVQLVIDVRMHANELQFYCVKPANNEDVTKYEDTLHSSAEAQPVQCGGRTVSYTGAISGGIVANYVRKWLMEGHVPGDVTHYSYNWDHEQMMLTAFEQWKRPPFVTLVDLQTMDMTALGKE